MDSTTKSIVDRLSEIETAAETILAQAESQKPLIEKKFQAEYDQFDKDLEKKTQEEFTKLRNDFETKKNRLLDGQKETNRTVINSLIADFEENHTTYAKDILSRITGEQHG